MKEISNYILEKLKINKDTKVENILNINLNNLRYSHTKEVINNCSDWFNMILDNLDKSFINKIQSLYEKALSKGIYDFDKYIDDTIPSITLNEYLANDFSNSAYKKDKNDKYSINFIKTGINKASDWQNIYDLFWNTLLEYCENNIFNKDSNELSLNQFKSIDEALNLIFKSIINEKS